MNEIIISLLGKEVIFLLDFIIKYTVYKKGNIYPVLFLTLLTLLLAGKYKSKCN